MFCTNCGNSSEGKSKFCTHCGQEIKLIGFWDKLIIWTKSYKKALLIILGIFVLLIILGSINTSSTQAPKTTAKDKIAASVVNILCTDDTDNESGSGGGSGTIMDSDGLILTNAHIIPHSETEDISKVWCLVTLPDAQGKVREIYYGQPLLIPSLSNEYDLAFVQINAAYTDDEGVTWGTYPNTFQSFIKSICENDDVKLGEPVRVFGYPSISAGGYFLTVTDGVVSSLPNDGTIVTSAKISHGNSGGIAVDENGCFIGIPSMFRGDEVESLGVLIPNSVVSEFMNKMETYLDSSKN